VTTVVTTSAVADSKRSRYWSWRVFVATWIGYAGFYFCRRNIEWTPLPASSHLDAHGWMNGLASLLLVFSAGYTLGQLVGGWAADRFGARGALLFGGLLSCASTLMLIVPAPVAAVMLLQALNGFGQGFGWPAVVRLFSVWVPRSQFAVGFAWWSTSYALGSYLANALATALSTVDSISISTGSRLAIAVPSGVLLLTTLFFYVRARNFPADVGLKPINPEPAPQAGTEQESAKTGWKTIVRNAEIQLLAVTYFFLKLTRYALLFWLPLYIIETNRTRGSSAVMLSSLFELTGFLGAVFGSYASDRWFGARRYPVNSAMLFLAAFVFFLHPLMNTWGTAPTALSISLIGILIFGPDVLVSSVSVIEAVSAEQSGRAAGYVNAVGSLGQMVSPVLVAFCSQRFGWNSIFTLFVACSLIAGTLQALRWNAPAWNRLSLKMA
jgi:sugar phosphate permease